jgi:hypothetical protein
MRSEGVARASAAGGTVSDARCQSINLHIVKQIHMSVSAIRPAWHPSWLALLFLAYRTPKRNPDNSTYKHS